ncbi:hypothetical protein AAG593_15130 [Citromicrobium bathyomarinum]
MSGSQPTDEQILEAMQASGFLMEQEVATQVEDLGFHVHPSRAFKDSEEGKSREIDVWGIRRFLLDEDRKFSAYSELIIECKNSSNPYVFLTRRKGESDTFFVPPEMRFPVKNYEARKDLGNGRGQLKYFDPFDEYGFSESHPFFVKEQKAVQFCRIDRKGKDWAANHGGLYDSLFIPLLKALKSRQADTAPRSANEEWKNAWFFYPIIVVRGRLLEIDSMAEHPAPVEVPMVPFVRHMESQDIKGRYLVYFVNENALADFVNEVVIPIEERLKSIDTDELLTKERNWRDD